MFKVRDSLTISLGSSILVSGGGYRGGSVNQQGESFAGSQVISTSANYGGGGGECTQACYVLQSAGGGGYGSVGGSGLGGEAGGSTYGAAPLDTLFLGSGGGGNLDSGCQPASNGPDSS